MRIDADVVVPDLSLRDSITKTLETEVYPFFNSWARQIAEKEVARRPNQKYTVTVDGYLVEGTQNIHGAKKEVRVVWLQSAVRFAVREYARILKRSAGERAASNEYWPDSKRDEVPREVVVFYGGDGKPTRQVTSYRDIDLFEPGDFIMVTSSSPWQQYLNARGKAKNSARVYPLKKDMPNYGGGYFGLAARRIRRLLGAERRSGTALWVGAVRSRAVLKAIGPPPLNTLAGRVNWARLQDWGAWAIMIKLSKRTPQGAVQGGR